MRLYIHHAATGFFVFFAVAFPIQVVWRETEPRFGSNQVVWRETGLRFGSNQWFGVKPSPDLVQTNGLA